MGSKGLQHKNQSPAITEENFVSTSPNDAAAIADDTPAVMPNETTIAMNTAAINEHVEEAPFEVMDSDTIEALNREEKHSKLVFKIMMNVVAPSSTYGHAQKFGALDMYKKSF